MIYSNEIASARIEYLALPDNEWRKDYFDEETGGYVATHVLKAKDAMKRPGIVKEVEACLRLAKMGKHVLRLPENIADKINVVIIHDRPYRDLLKFKPLSSIPRGYPDVYFDGQTWDFKTSTYNKEDTLRQHIKNGRKADNVIFVTKEIKHLKMIEKVINREIGKRKKDGSWKELPNIVAFTDEELISIWEKR